MGCGACCIAPSISSLGKAAGIACAHLADDYRCTLFGQAGRPACCSGLQPSEGALYTQAAHMGHAKSMNLLARHLEDGLDIERDPQAALAWYQRSAEAGDFRGQANLASILLQQGQIEQAVHWLRLALANGSPAFMAHIVPELAASPHPQIRALVA